MSKKEANPVREQGVEAKKLGLTEAACPYADGDNRADWLEGFGVEAPIVADADVKPAE